MTTVKLKPNDILQIEALIASLQKGQEISREELLAEISGSSTEMSLIRAAASKAVDLEVHIVRKGSRIVGFWR